MRIDFQNPRFRPTPLMGLAVAVLAGLAHSATAADPVPELRYAWKAGQTHAYNVTIEADYGDYLELLSGTPVYQIQSADQDGIKLAFRGGLAEKQQLKPGKKGILFPSPRSPFSAFTGIGMARGIEMTINDRGEVVTLKGSSQIPFLLGNLSQLMVEPLPKDAQKTWKVSRDLSIVPSQGGFPRPIFRDDDRTQIKATMETTYTLDKVDADTVTITRTVTMKTAETVGGMPRIEIQGEGTVTFDRKKGCPSKLEAQHKLISREAGKTDETPVKISYRLLDDKERADLAKTTEGAPLFPGEPLPEELRKKALDDLKSGDKARLLKALLLLQAKEPAKPDPEMAAALVPLLEDKEMSMRFSAVKALARWATDDTVPALVKALDGSDVLVRHFAMEALGRLKAEAGAEPIAKRLPEIQDRLRARQALEVMGAVAEPAVLKLAEHADPLVRNEACTVLAKIGTERSLTTLKTLEGDANPLVKRSAKQAREAIEKRK